MPAAPIEGSALARKHHVVVGDAAVGAELLGAVEDVAGHALHRRPLPVVFIASESEPGSGSVRPRPPRTTRSGLQNSGSQRFFCFLRALARMPVMARPGLWMQTAMPAQPQCSLLGHDQAGDGVEAGAAVGLGENAAGVRPRLWAFATTS